MLDQTLEQLNSIKKEKTVPESRCYDHVVRWEGFNLELKRFCPYSEV